MYGRGKGWDPKNPKRELRKSEGDPDGPKEAAGLLGGRWETLNRVLEYKSSVYRGNLGWFLEETEKGTSGWERNL